MTTTPLPPSYGIWTTDEDGNRVMGFTPEQFLSVWQSRAELKAENAKLREALEDVGLFLHHCWCDVQMNDYSFEKLNRQMEAVDAALKETP